MSLTRFSANLGFLWMDKSLPDAIRAAANAGFDAVECHWPYQTPAADVKAALDETGLPMLGLNTSRGQPEKSDNGLAAIPGRETEARATIEEALKYATAIGAGAVHVMAGFSEGLAAQQTFLSNLEFATDLARDANVMILIEPLNRHDAPGYFLQTTNQARQIIETVASPRLKLMFDCYHVGRTEGDLVTRFLDLQPLIGHVQFASVPDRGPPDRGEIDYTFVFDALAKAGWDRPLGAEYRPESNTDASLDWLRDRRAAAR